MILAWLLLVIAGSSGSCAIACGNIARARCPPRRSGWSIPAAPPAAAIWRRICRKIAYWRLDESCGCGQWQASDAAAFQASAVPGVPTTVLIHGNGTDEDWAVRHGNELYGLMKQQACGRPFRLVVWSWPADRVVRRIRPDVQIKVCRSDVEAYYLARVLSGLPKGAPLSLVGYSLGCRTVSGALQLLAGGPVAGRSLAPEALAAWNKAGPRPIRVMMVAAAMDADWLEPCCPARSGPLGRRADSGRDQRLRSRLEVLFAALRPPRPRGPGLRRTRGHGGGQARSGRRLLRGRPEARFRPLSGVFGRLPASGLVHFSLRCARHGRQIGRKIGSGGQ